MNGNLLLLVTFLAVAPAPQGVEQATRPIREVGADDYAVYSAAIEETIREIKGELVVLKATTITENSPARLGVTRIDAPTLDKQTKAILGDLIARYMAINKRPCRLSGLLKLRVPYQLLSKAQEEYFLNGPGGFGAFAWKYPKARGVTMVSRVGFDFRHDHALVTVITVCGDLCGSGHVILLKKTVEGWKVVQRKLAWVS